MSDPFYAAVLAAVWQRGGHPEAVSRSRVEMCDAIHLTVDAVATLEIELQVARDRVARDMARLNVVSK
jgi:hypothetical protein